MVLVMTASTQTSSLLGEYLASMDYDALPGQRGRKMLEKKLRRYLYWKARLSARSAESQPPSANRRQSPPRNDEISPALRKKDRDNAERAASRRRVRGGAPGTVKVREQGPDQVSVAPREEEGVLAELYVCFSRPFKPGVNAYQSLDSGQYIRRCAARLGVIIGRFTPT